MLKTRTKEEVTEKEFIHKFRAALILISIFSSPILCHAQSGLFLVVQETEIVPYAPIVVHLTINRREPSVASDCSPRIHPLNFVGHVYKRDRKVCDVFFGSGGFGKARDAAHERRATMLGILGTLSTERTETAFELFGRQGTYRLEVVDINSGCRSNSIVLEIASGDAHGTEAGHIFATGGRDLLLAVQTLRVSESIRMVLYNLELQYRDTEHGHYAAGILSQAKLQTVLSDRARKEDLDICELVAEVAEGAQAFAPSHPMRNRAFWLLAQVKADCVTGALGGDALQKLLAKATDDRYLEIARELHATNRSNVNRYDSPDDP